jgi:hypothetical protein
VLYLAPSDGEAQARRGGSTGVAATRGGLLLVPAHTQAVPSLARR